MKNVFIVFSGEYLLMEIASKQLEGTLPVFRIEGVFGDREKSEAWMKSHVSGKVNSMLSILELPLNPEFGQMEKGMQLFSIRMDKNLKIIEISLNQGSTLPEGKLYSYEILEDGTVNGCFWARDFIDACKLAYIRVKEDSVKNARGNTSLS
ncbi:hypothetical protein LZF95_23330 [Algoriphagus sp. AGSA1]|uniref:hypothetical protein n=1 Tax=Algoriphagus sp. AGSA1 TaxID=2907213 RepID=UPI001F395E77|nr:hypothetical protein [Algoriphagus sp. AGSA1]MCE7057634.1 hypothetical protein [Algoriphagus sp. AGSA1]